MPPISIAVFLEMCQDIQAAKPAYKSGCDGSNGFCDCIGLIIGAIRRAGGKWPGIHGSNFAARREMSTWDKITSAGQLQPGMVVYKGRDSSNKKYALPTRYKPSGAYHNGDLTDYYHVGVVISAAPLRIMHCTSWTGGSGIKTDTQIGAWAFGGWLTKVSREGGETGMETLWVGKVIGGGLNLRATASDKAACIVQIPSGAQVKVLDKQAAAGWVYVEYSGKQGYVMREYLQDVESVPDGSVTVSIAHAKLDRVQAALGEAREAIADLLANGVRVG